MNSGNYNARIVKSNTNNMKASITVPGIDSTWGYDPANNWLDSAYLRNWRSANGSTKDEVYIFRQGNSQASMRYYKFKIKAVSIDNYTLEYDTIIGITPKTITIPKNAKKNFVYFSFSNGGKALDLEPEKTTWDIVCMPYHEPFYYASPFLYYPVTGVLSNSYNTMSAGDSTITSNFSKFSIDSISKYQLNNANNNIGYNWKKPDANYNYITNSNLLYLVKTQQGHLYKMHFLDFYFQGTEKGAPKMEWERIQ
jgi:hypothetical protein